jgi:BirA family biotin operon repressor/biotin-[acetyl-CoA-carboxylase] ligase
MIDDLLLDQQAAKKALKQSKGLHYTIKAYDVVDSTSDEMRRLIQKGKGEEGTVVFASTQTQGHGRMGREWHSPKGNLYLSLLLKPKENVRILPQLSFVAAVAIADAVSPLLSEHHKLACKWPNDLLLNGKKFAGILLESSLAAGGASVDWLIIGVGLNITRPPENTDFISTSLGTENAEVLTDERMRDAVLKSFARYYALWQEEGFAPIRETWLSRAAFLNKEINVTTAGGEYKGVFEDINRQGELVLLLPDGRRRLVSAGEVFFAQ